MLTLEAIAAVPPDRVLIVLWRPTGAPASTEPADVAPHLPHVLLARHAMRLAAVAPSDIAWLRVHAPHYRLRVLRRPDAPVPLPGRTETPFVVVQMEHEFLDAFLRAMPGFVVCERLSAEDHTLLRGPVGTPLPPESRAVVLSFAAYRPTRWMQGRGGDSDQFQVVLDSAASADPFVAALAEKPGIAVLAVDENVVRVAVQPRDLEHLEPLNHPAVRSICSYSEPRLLFASLLYGGGRAGATPAAAPDPVSRSE